MVGCDKLVDRLDRAVVLDDVEKITLRIKNDLTEMIQSSDLELPDRIQRPKEDCYARRLFHRDPDLRYTVVVMTWGVGQRTPLHDHAGLWCVEVVAKGAVEVTQFDLLEDSGDVCRFDEVSRIEAGPGVSGSLIPPYEYHVLGNARADQPSVTIHVYGGEMSRCCAYMPRDDGLYVRTPRELPYHE